MLARESGYIAPPLVFLERGKLAAVAVTPRRTLSKETLRG
jgi:hypothetical protein